MTFYQVTYYTNQGSQLTHTLGARGGRDNEAAAVVWEQKDHRDMFGSFQPAIIVTCYLH